MSGPSVQNRNEGMPHKFAGSIRKELAHYPKKVEFEF